MAEQLQLVEKHPRAIRWMHWVNFPVLFVMIWSGLLIYWGDSIPPYQHAHQVYRIGIGSWTLVRFFPDWFWKWLNAPYQITTGLGWHWFFMWIFAANGIAYVLYLVFSGEWRVLWPQRKSFVDAMWVTLYDMHMPFARRRGLPPQGKYNGGQRIAYTAVIFMGAGSLFTGLAIYKPSQAHWLTTLCGGYEMARWLHFWLTMGFCGFFLVHVVQVVLAGWNNFRSMVSGYAIEKHEGRHAVAAEAVDAEIVGMEAPVVVVEEVESPVVEPPVAEVEEIEVATAEVEPPVVESVEVETPEVESPVAAVDEPAGEKHDA